jgi:hypothetical protein
MKKIDELTPLENKILYQFTQCGAISPMRMSSDRKETLEEFHFNKALEALKKFYLEEGGEYLAWDKLLLDNSK